MPAPFDEMICLVGENSLPVYLGIKRLATPEADVVLVYSETTKPQAKNIRAFLAKVMRRLLFLLTKRHRTEMARRSTMPNGLDADQGRLLEAYFRFTVRGLWFVLWVRDILRKLLRSWRKIVMGAQIDGRDFMACQKEIFKTLSLRNLSRWGMRKTRWDRKGMLDFVGCW